MAELYAVGVNSIKIGNIASDGGMGTSLASLGSTFEGTVNFQDEDPALTEFYSEETDDPIYQSKKPGLKKFGWAIVDWSPDTLVKVFGGSVVGSGANAVWHAPSSEPTIEQSLEFITKTGTKYEFTRCSLTAKASGNVGKSAMAQIPITATVLTPTKTGESSRRVSKVSV